MPQLDFYNILSQIEFGLFIFIFFYFFSVFFFIPTVLTIFFVRAYFKSFPLQLFNSYSSVACTMAQFYLENFSNFSIEYIFTNNLCLEQIKFNEYLFAEFILSEF